MTCEHWRDTLTEYAASGEPDDSQFAALRAHLASCQHCQEDLSYLRRVESALWAWPLETVSAAMHHRLVATAALAHVSPDTLARAWVIWLPAVTVLISIVLALTLAPAPVPVTTATLPMETAPLLSFDQETWRAIWVGVSVALAGVGVTMALWDARMPAREDLDTWRKRAAEGIERAWNATAHSR